MKLFTTILFSLALLNCKAQDSIRGALYDYNTKTFLSIPTGKTQNVTLTSIDKFGKRKVKLYKVSNNGQFSIPATDIDTLGDNFTFSVMMFYEGDRFNYADFEIRNIKKDSTQKVLSQVYLIPAYWTNSCGDDCFVIDNKRTFKRRIIDIVTPYASYQIRRQPDKISQRLLNMKYVVDLNSTNL
jgi:hypothetical protein